MKHQPGDRRCTYLVILENNQSPLTDLRELAEYLSFVSICDFDVVAVDGSPLPFFERNRRVLRWVARHIAARAQHRGISGAIDPVRAAIDVAGCERIIIADERVRYCEESLEDMCALLELHEVVEPQDYFDPMPW